MLNNNLPRIYEIGERNSFPMAAGAILYEGSAVGINPATGYARQLVAGDIFVGFSEAKFDNSLGNAGDQSVRPYQEGRIQLPVAGAAITNLGAPVYASDDNTFTLTQGSNTYIGRVYRFVSPGIVVVAFESSVGGTLTPLNPGPGVASATIADVGSAFSQATLNNNFASLAATLNSIVRMLQ
jgi:hypothetical protein